ncbi:Xanthine/uracil/vitamin C permease [Hesseltinella vesiculosa]|uniref:Xanthine/uracil/vitamin C permease n=1 Tax=Hesseltinella vesiculosa TaxID=101127 RepID=A0A1X2G5T1_9FUNG|nr:Xanthine/uracil/vitamin C permease [Hesseltinella vesiculosa]
MFSGTVFIPMQLGFDINTAIFFSGVSTLLFFVVNRGRVPAYLGCSGSAVAAIMSISGYKYQPGVPNDNIAAVQGALIVLGIVYAAISLIVHAFGHKWVEAIMPPVVTGAIICGIGLHLMTSSFQQATSSFFDGVMAFVTVVVIMFFSVYAPSPFLRRLCILLGTIVSYVIYLICGLVNAGPRIDFSNIVAQPWVRPPIVHWPVVFQGQAISTMIPLVIVFLAENMGHLKALSAITETSLEKYLGNAYMGDALSIILCGSVGSPPLTTYAENMIVLSVTRIYSPLVIVSAAFIAIVLGFFSKFGAVVSSIPAGVFGGLTIVLYTIIAITGVRIWMDNKVDFSDQRNMFVGGIPVAIASVMQTQLKINHFELDGIGVSTFLALFLYQLLFAGEHIKTWLRQRRQLSDTLP